MFRCRLESNSGLRSRKRLCWPL